MSMGKNGNRMGGYEWELQRIMDIDFSRDGGIKPNTFNAIRHVPLFEVDVYSQISQIPT